MTVIYIESPNGNQLSYDGAKRYEAITGKDAYDYLQTEEAKAKHFVKLNDPEDIDIVLIEASEQYIEDNLAEHEHEKYLNSCKKEFPISTIPFSVFEEAEDGNGITCGEYIIADDSYNPESHHIELDRLLEFYQTLDEAYASLTDAEFDIIKALYLRERRASAREFAREIGIPQRTLNDQKNRVLKKIEKFL